MDEIYCKICEEELGISDIRHYKEYCSVCVDYKNDPSRALLIKVLQEIKRIRRDVDSISEHFN